MTPFELQRWLQDIVTDPRADDLVTADAAREIATVLLPARLISAAESLHIYRQLYIFRYIRALRAAYPNLLHHLGGRRFDQLVVQYAASCPSRFWNMNRVGSLLPAFLESCPGLYRRAFCAELARLELALLEVYETAEGTVLRHHALGQRLAILDRATLHPASTVRLMTFRYPVNDFMTAFQANQPKPRTARRDTWLLIHKRNYDVFRQPLSQTEHDLLAALFSGVPLGQALQQSQHPDPAMLFFNWVSQGIFSAITPGGDA